MLQELGVCMFALHFWVHELFSDLGQGACTVCGNLFAVCCKCSSYPSELCPVNCVHYTNFTWMDVDAGV